MTRESTEEKGEDCPFQSHHVVVPPSSVMFNDPNGELSPADVCLDEPTPTVFRLLPVERGKREKEDDEC